MKRYIALAALMAAFATPAAAQSVAPAPGVAVAPAPLLVPMTAEGFRAMALQSDAFEIASSQLALQRSRNPAIRSFARQMVQDHSMTSQALGVPAGSAVALDARHASMLNQLAPLSGRAFDAAYGQMQVMAHQEAVGMFAAYAQGGVDPAMRAFAQQVLPSLQMHLTMAQRLTGRRGAIVTK
jgi:putative membrane protein